MPYIYLLQKIRYPTLILFNKTYNAEDRAKDLLLVGSHVSIHVGDDGGSYKVTIGVLVDLCPSSVQQESSSLVNRRLDKFVDSILGLGRDNRANVSSWFMSCTQLK